MTKFFRPQKDITAYEVALIFARTSTIDYGERLWSTPVVFTGAQWDEIGEMQRHFVDSIE